MSETVPKVYSAISAVMGKLSKEGISKAQKNTQQGYKFRGIDDVYNALAAHLAEAKLLILPRVLSRSVTERETAKGGVLFYVVLDVEFDFVSAEDGSKHIIKVPGEAMDSGDKATNKAMSAAYKYACMEAFCIPTEGDNDADATTHEDIKHRSASPRPEGWDKQDTKKTSEYCKRINDAINEGRNVLEVWDEVRQGDEAFVTAVWVQLSKPVQHYIRDEMSKRGKEAA